jgi:predicted DsbA family dithiol-disulfide isomerase
LLWFADTPGAVAFGADADTQPRLADLLYRAHFRDGLDVSAHEVLTSLAADVGLDGQRVRALLESGEGSDEVRRELAEAHEIGITAVPTFVFDGRYAVVGAHEASTLRGVLDQALQAGSGSIGFDRAAEAVDDDRTR